MKSIGGMMMETITEVRTVPGLGIFTIAHEIKPHKAWRIPRLPRGKNKAGGAKCYAPKVETKAARPASRLVEGEKFMLALKLRANLIAKIAKHPPVHYGPKYR